MSKKDTALFAWAEQFIKFGAVGALCFLIDFALYTLCNHLGIPYLISGIIGFSVSVVVNYLLSMRYVFKRRNDLSRRREFIIFVFLSVIGLGLNELLLYVCIDVYYDNNSQLIVLVNNQLAKTIAKIIATIVVTVFNFVSRKVLLENKE